jgi:hypothetical protein
MFRNMKEETIIKSWFVSCDNNGTLWCNGIVCQVLDAKNDSDEEKAALLSNRKAKYLARMQDSWKEKQAVLGDMDAVRAAEQWDYEYNIRKKYLPLIIPDWLLSGEDITLLAADICSPLFVENIKKYFWKKKVSWIVVDDFIPDFKIETEPAQHEINFGYDEETEKNRQSYLKSHPYITKSMECFVSMEWGVWDYPDGEILKVFDENTSSP